MHVHLPLRPSLPSPSPPARRRRPQAALGRGAHHPPRRGPESLGAAAGHRAGCTRLPGVAAGLPLVSPCPWPIWPPGCLCSDLVSLGQWPPQPPSPPQEDVTALQSCRLRLQRKSLTQGRQKHVAFYSPGSVLRVRERRMDHFCAHCLRRDRYSNLERHTVQSITGGPWLGRGPAAGMRVCLSSPGGGGHFDYKGCFLGALHGSPRRALHPELRGRREVYRGGEEPRAGPGRPGTRGAFAQVWPLSTSPPPNPSP